jgi:cell division protein FtsZ
MIHFDLPKEKSSILKVIGVGGGGGNAVNFMFSQQIEGVNFIICNTDAQALACSGIPNRVQLGPHLTQGLGAGANPEIGRQATEESLEEIKRILEVNTKMAFITAGMGGGTGTGGAPIIAKVCKDLGILTVGIVTTPFAYEGRKRQQQAEDGIKILKQYVDTLLVISNDKLRHQFGNLKMREAFERADNVLATAAKCITDVINSTGQINVDFADVCTVMRNGGVAILGNATATGENRAQKAIEEAMNSPLLNDNDIRGAKWILININSSEGENEFTMDEVEIIQNYLLSQAGDNTDVILGMGYDNTLGSSIGITLIATGFEHKDPFTRRLPKKEGPKKEEKIVMILGQVDDASSKLNKKDDKKIESAVQMTIGIEKEMKAEDKMAPKLIEDLPIIEAPVFDITDIKEQETPIIHWELSKEPLIEKQEEKILSTPTVQTSTTTVGKMWMSEKKRKYKFDSASGRY